MTNDNPFDFSQFYYLSDALVDMPYRFAPTDKSFTTDEAFAVGRSELLPARPLEFKATMGENLASFLWSEMTPLLFVSDQVESIFRDAHVSGWSTYPVALLNRFDEYIPGYKGLSIVGRAGTRDFTNSELVDNPPRSAKGRPYRAVRGLYFRYESWDGSDLFLLDGLRIARESVVCLLEKHRITNVHFTPINEVEFSESSVLIRNPEVIKYLEEKRI